VEKLYENLEYSNSYSFWWIKDFLIKRINGVFGYNQKDGEMIGQAIKHRKDWVIIENYKEEGQKYILGVDSQNKKLMFITDNLPHHINIKRKYIPNWFCLWWWRLTLDNKNKAISLYWKSRVYGGIAWKEKEAMLSLLKKFYPDYRINHDN
jgi:hypothetical protein